MILLEHSLIPNSGIQSEAATSHSVENQHSKQRAHSQERRLQITVPVCANAILALCSAQTVPFKLGELFST